MRVGSRRTLVYLVLLCEVIAQSVVPHRAAAQAAAQATAQAPSPGHYAEINGARIYYEDEGSGHPLVLIHGWPMSARMWDEQVRVLKTHYRVIRYDRRGFGRSPGTPWNESSAEHDPADLEALLQYLKISHIYVLGHSQGGSVATQFTLDHPDQVDALILHGAGLDGFVLPETGPFAEHDSVRVLMRDRGMAEFRKQWLAHPINHVPDGKPEVAALIADIVGQYSGADVLQSTPAPRAPHTAAIYRLHEIRVPALVMVGGDDMPFFRITADALTFLIPGAHEAVVRGGGHLVNLIEPELYNAEVLRFLRAVDRASGAHGASGE
jgi:pimeloyl-ACP methyl ester carboxylesterase